MKHAKLWTWSKKCPKKCLNRQMRTQVWLSGCALTPHITSWDVGENTVRLLNLKTRKICHVSRCSSQLGPIVAECRLCSGTRWPTVSWVWHIHCTAAKLSQWQVASSVTKAGFSKFLFFFFLCNIHLLRNKQFGLSGWLRWPLNHIPNHMNAFLNQLLASWPFTT